VVDIGRTLYVVERDAWRAWLAENHRSQPEIWLVFYRKASGKPSLPYGDAVEEALCFGWIDSVVKKHGPESRAQRFTPRRPGSPVSEMNKERARRMIEAGRMTEAGLVALGSALEESFEIPPDIIDALREDDQTWRNFRALPEAYVRIRLGFIEAAHSRPEVRRQRLDYFLRMTRQNKRFGMIR
jgi:uncharacterized protein YdeI (YjbR/CyaY-like superfamily)